MCVIVASRRQSRHHHTHTHTHACKGHVCVLGCLCRHDVGITQAGPETNTDMGHFILAGPNQLHDLHTKLALDHPEVCDTHTNTHARPARASPLSVCSVRLIETPAYT